jgi:tight adherence protein B
MLILMAAIAAVGAAIVFWWAVAGARTGVTGQDPATESQPEALKPVAPSTDPKRAVDARKLASRLAVRLAAPALRGKRNVEVQTRLSAAGTGLKPHEFLGLQFLAAAVLGLMGFVRFGNVLPAVGLGFVGYFLPRFWLRRLEKKRRMAIERQLADVINLLANALKAGHSTQQALATVAEAGREPMGSELQRVVREVQLGLELDVALRNVNERLKSKDFDMLVTAVIIHRRVGGNLADVLGKISHTVRERVKVHGEVRVLTAQARASGYIVTGLPFAVGAMLSLISPGFERPLFQSPLGWGMVTVGLIMVSVGYAIISKISDITL